MQWIMHCPLYKVEIHNHDVWSGLVKLILIETYHVNESLGLSVKGYIDPVN